MYSGASWIKTSLKKEMSPLGEAVADLLGRVFRGIYHLNTTSLNKVDWSNDYWIEFTIDRGLSTVDFNDLTALVVYGHDQMIRIELTGTGPRYMKMLFHQRKTRTGSMSKRYPTIEDHIFELRNRECAN